MFEFIVTDADGFELVVHAASPEEARQKYLQVFPEEKISSITKVERVALCSA